MEQNLEITERIKTFEDALAYNGETIEQFNKRTEHDSPWERSVKQIASFHLALNEGNKLNGNDARYYPIFYGGESGFGFFNTIYDHDSTFSSVGSRLCVNSRAKAKHSAVAIKDIWKVYMFG